jgi:hypothetical protein
MGESVVAGIISTGFEVKESRGMIESATLD